LARAWHERCLADPIVSHAFSHGVHSQHTERLAAYWAEALGGPPNYSTTIGDDTSVIRKHAGNGQSDEIDSGAQACFVAALEDVQFEPAVRETLAAYFLWRTKTMSSYPESADDVPAGLRSPRWSWDGPVDR
jgi:hemoglobin